MAPIINKIHQLKNGFVQMEYLDEATGLRFYWRNNKLADKPILLFPSGMITLVRALPKAYEIYDEQVLIRAKASLPAADRAKAEAAEAKAEDEIICSVNIATTKVLQINLEVSVYKGKLYIFLKKSSWALAEEGGDPNIGTWRPCRGNILLDRYQDDPEVLLQFALSAHKE
jgi:hypothetical protein